MRGRRLVLKHLLVYFLLGSLFGVAPGAAQDTPAESVPLRLVHGGDFLPRGTALVVLGDRSRNEPGPSWQPRFLAPDAYWVYIVLAFALACIAGLLFLTLHYRTQLAIKTEPDTPRFNAADWHPDCRVGLEQELTEIKTNYERLQKTYNVLLDRHKMLIREVQKLHQGTEQAPQETPTQRFPQDPPKAGST